MTENQFTNYADSTVIERAQSSFLSIREKMELFRTTAPAINMIGQEWNKAVDNRSRWPRAVYGLLGAVLVALWIGIIVTFQKDEEDYQQKHTGGAMRPITRQISLHPIVQPAGNATGSPPGHFEDRLKATSEGLAVAHLLMMNVYWILEGTLQRFDPTARILSINWALKYGFENQTFPLATHLNETFQIGIFRDQFLIPVDENYNIIYPNTPNKKPHDFQVANVSAVPTAIVGTTPLDSFSTEIDMTQRKVASPMTQPNLGFPFDLWSGSISFVANLYDYAIAVNPETPTTHGLTIKDVCLVDSIMNWRITVEVKDSCMESKDGEWKWIADEACGLNITVRASRPLLVKFACITAVMVNWFSTIFIFILTCEGVIMRRFQVIMGPQLLAVCFTALFALPSVRSILPGAPEFGSTIDLIGIVPNVIIISICTTLVAITTLRQIVEETKQDVGVDVETQRKNV